VPQENAHLRAMSISSLGTYASSARHFLVVAPSVAARGSTPRSATHACDLDSYSRRGWCRLEQWARLSVGGAADMYSVGAGGSLDPLTDPHWLRQSIHVFGGEFTLEEDKLKLVDVVLGLWWRSLTLPKAERSPSHAELHELVRQHRAAVFPAVLFEMGSYCCVRIVEELAAQQTSRSGSFPRSMRVASEKLVAAVTTSGARRPASPARAPRWPLGRWRVPPSRELPRKSIDLGVLLDDKGWRAEAT
jgi:hypothetical protein